MQYRFIRFPNGKQKAVTFSYDDCVKSDLRLADILEKHKMKCTFNVPNTFIGDDGRMTAEELKDLHSRGHEIAVHCARHRAPGHQRAIEGIQDIMENRLELEKLLGCIVRGMAYPNSGIRSLESGVSYDEIRGYLKDLDIAYSRTLGGDNDGFSVPVDWYAWMPTAHHDNPHIFEYIDKFVNIKIDDSTYYGAKGAKLFYIWGHTFEFDGKNNWDRMEEICDKIGGKEDTWYATNIEIYDYVNAYYSLIFSADGKIIYNPTLTDVWFECDNNMYCIKSGETIKID